jgi:hypothetical protein
VRVVGFERVLKDEGKGSHVDHFEAYRTGSDVKAAAPQYSPSLGSSGLQLLHDPGLMSHAPRPIHPRQVHP